MTGKFDKMTELLNRFYSTKNEYYYRSFLETGIYEYLTAIAYRIVKNRHLANEATNTVLIRIRKPPQMPFKNLQNYLCTSVTRASYDIMKKYRLGSQHLFLPYNDSAFKVVHQQIFSNNYELAMEEAHERLYQYLTEEIRPKTLTHNQAYTLVEVAKGSKCAEIAVDMGKTLSTVRAYLRDARKIIKENKSSKEDIIKVFVG